jgi:phosphinothricin acetyltransferase
MHTPSEAIIRPATRADCPAITAITNNEIKQGRAHFATTPDDTEATAAQFHRDSPVYPWFAAESDGTVVGFSRASPWKPREAYDWTCESAVYLTPQAQGKGLGKRLYDALFVELERRGFRCIIAGVMVPNPPSERLHEAMGMTAAGEFQAVGFKQGQWLAVRYYSLTLGDGSEPTPILPVC